MELPWIALSFLAVIGLERTRWRRLPARFLRPHFAADLTFFATGVVALGLTMRSAAAALGAQLGFAPLAAWPPVAALALALLVYDLGAWLAHRAMHHFAFLWEAHKVHHASPHLDWLAAFRMHPLEHAIRHAISPVLMLLAGFPAAHVAVASILAGGWAAFVHGNLQVGSRALEWLLVTPRLHHLHHIPESCEQNFGAIFSVWDRLARRLTTAPAARDAKLGVPGEEHSHPHGWWAQVRTPFVRAERTLSPQPQSQRAA
ncbi:MAG: sterol desaturase family protein [Deltaproteobacteria bacterium]|nr:sterol desaturase family protein [Deltaproteobacteria bacterium]